MNNIIKKFLITVSTFSLILILFKPVFADEIIPRYNNTLTTSDSFTISNNGLATITYNYIGIPNVTTKAVITSYLEKKTLGLFWRRVDIGTTDDEWWILLINLLIQEVAHISYLPQENTG